jgi:hypothetical protein
MKLPMHLLLQRRLHVTPVVSDWESEASMGGEAEAPTERRG